MIRLSTVLRVTPKLIPSTSNYKWLSSSRYIIQQPTSTTQISRIPSYRFATNPKGKRSKEEESLEQTGQEKLFDKDGNELKDPTKNIEDEEKEDEASFQNENKKSIYVFVVASLGLLGGYAVMQMNTMREEKKSTKGQKVTYTGKADIGGSWQLHDMQGNTVTSKDMKGSYYLLYFGFCHCPDICPISLQKISKALDHIRKMPEYRYIKLKTLFVSVDPDRDTPERMHKFLVHFDKSIIGLTGKSNDDPELRSMMNKFRIYASKIELDETPLKPGEKRPYTLDHTIITYLIDDSNNYLTHLGSNLSDRDLSQIIVDAVLSREREKSRGITN